MICRQCKKPTSPVAKKCVHCGGIAKKIFPRKKSSILECPQCLSKLDPVMLGDVELDLCNVCVGIWFDKNEMRAFINDASKKQTSSSIKNVLRGIRNNSGRKRKKVYANCPVCNSLMTRRTLNGTHVVLDFCTDHGLWADFDKILDLLKLTEERDFSPERLDSHLPKESYSNKIVLLLGNSDDLIPELKQTSEAMDWAKIALGIMEFFSID